MPANKKALTVLLGGTFDPVHNGHLRLAAEIQLQIADAEVVFIPLGVPAHRQTTIATATQRLSMLQLALDTETGFKIDQSEIQKTRPSYSIETLELLVKTQPENTFIWAMGTDAYQSLASWHRANELFKYCHLLVIERPTTNDNATLCHNAEKLGFLAAKQLSDFSQQATGLEFHLKLPMLDISSTRVRKLLANNESTSWLIPDQVRAFIDSHKLYNRDN